MDEVFNELFAVINGGIETGGPAAVAACSAARAILAAPDDEEIRVRFIQYLADYKYISLRILAALPAPEALAAELSRARS